MSKQNFKSVIVGVDLSDYSKKVVKEAQKLAHAMQANLVFVHAIQMDHFHNALNVEAPNLTTHYENEVRQKYGLKVDSHVVIRFGRPYEEVIAVARSYKRPLIIVGHRGHSAMARFFLGSNVERLALISPFPVWIHRGDKIIVPKRILVPSDLGNRSIRTIKDTKSFQNSFDSTCELFHVAPRPSPVLDFPNYAQILDEIKAADDLELEKFKKKNPTLKISKAEGQIVEKIHAFAKKFDVIAISPGPRKKSSPFFGGITAKIIRSGDKPILVFPI